VRSWLLFGSGGWPIRLFGMKPDSQRAQHKVCFDALLGSGALRDDHHLGGLRLGPRADEIFTSLGVNLEDVLPLRRRLAYRCLDWTERRADLGGGLGATLADAFLRDRLVRRRRGQRGLDVTPRAWLQIAKLEPLSRG